MTLQELINELQKLKSRVNEDIEVEVCIFYDREDFQMDQIDSIEVGENENDEQVVCITLKHAYSQLPY